MMNTKSISRTAKKRTQAPSQFQKLWAEAEALAQENADLHDELEGLVQTVKAEVGEAERDLANTLKQAIHRQLDFSEKKSLLKWQRAELNDWTDQLLDELMGMGAMDETLRNRLAVMQARSIGIELAETADESPAEQLRRYLDEEYGDEDDELSDSPTDQDFMDDEESFDELLRKFQEQLESGAFTEEAAPQSPGQVEPVIDDTVFKRLFRQTAAALHPDRETDTERKREKHELMSALLRARKERNLFTIMQLHHQHASAETELTAADEQELEAVLAEYLASQRNRKLDIVRSSPMHAWVYQQFYHKNPATVQRRVRAHIKKIRVRQAGFSTFVESVKTLKVLKLILADRYEESMQQRYWY